MKAWIESLQPPTWSLQVCTWHVVARRRFQAVGVGVVVFELSARNPLCNKKTWFMELMPLGLNKFCKSRFSFFCNFTWFWRLGHGFSCFLCVFSWFVAKAWKHRFLNTSLTHFIHLPTNLLTSGFTHSVSRSFIHSLINLLRHSWSYSLMALL